MPLIFQAIYRLKGDYRTKRADDTATLIFAGLDKDKDNEITEKEFIHGVKQAGIVEMLNPLQIE